jgi:hypothetical protein
MAAAGDELSSQELFRQFQEFFNQDVSAVCVSAVSCDALSPRRPTAPLSGRPSPPFFLVARRPTRGVAAVSLLPLPPRVALQPLCVTACVAVTAGGCLQHGEGPYMARIRRMMEDRQQRLLVDIGDVRRFDPRLAERYVCVKAIERCRTSLSRARVCRAASPPKTPLGRRLAGAVSVKRRVCLRVCARFV